MSAESNKRSLLASAEAWNSGDLDGYLGICASTVVHHGLDSRGPLDAAQNRASYGATYAAFAGSQLSVEDVVADGDKLASRFRLEGIHTAPFAGIPATANRIVLDGLNLMRFVDGKVVERWTIADVAGLLHQLGARLTAPPDSQ
jgi:predicted ester cyclase